MQDYRTMDHGDASRMRTEAVRTFAAQLVIQWNIFDDRATANSPVWFIKPPRPGDIDTDSDGRATVTDGQMMTFVLAIKHPYDKVSCNYLAPLMPTLSGHGAYYPLNDFLPYEYRSKNGVPQLAAAGSVERMLKTATALATDLWKRSVRPTMAVMPFIVKSLTDREQGLAAQKAVAAELVRRHPGMRHMSNHGDDIHISTGDVDLPGFSVSFNGRINIQRTFTMGLETASALYEAKAKESKRTDSSTALIG